MEPVNLKRALNFAAAILTPLSHLVAASEPDMIPLRGKERTKAGAEGIVDIKILKGAGNDFEP